MKFLDNKSLIMISLVVFIAFIGISTISATDISSIEYIDSPNSPDTCESSGNVIICNFTENHANETGGSIIFTNDSAIVDDVNVKAEDSGVTFYDEIATNNLEQKSVEIMEIGVQTIKPVILGPVMNVVDAIGDLVGWW